MIKYQKGLKKSLNNRKIAILFPKDSEAVFNKKSYRTFGGATIHLYQFVKELANHKDSITAYTVLPQYDDIDFDDKDCFNIISLYKEVDSSLLKFIKFIRFLYQYKPEVIMQLGLTLGSCILSVFCKIFGIKFVFFFAHDVESRGFYQNRRTKCGLFMLLIRYSDLLITQNDIQKQNLVDDFPQTEFKIKVLKKGLDFSKIRKSKSKRFDAIWIARCEEWKNIEAFIQLARENPDNSFVIISPPVPGKEGYYSQIISEISELSNVTYYRFVPYEKVYELISESKILAVTSDIEGDWPLTVLEAVSSAVPILSLNLNYGSLIDTYNAGIFCNHDQAVMNASFRYIIGSEDILNNMSDNALNYAQKEHDITINTKLLIEYIDGLKY